MASVFHGGPRKKPPKRHEIAGARISCVLYLCKSLFQGNTKADAWLNPFFRVCVCACVCIRAPPPSRLRRHLAFTPPPAAAALLWARQCVVSSSASRPHQGPGMGLGASAGGGALIEPSVKRPSSRPYRRALAPMWGRAGARTEEQGRLSKRTQREGSC